MTVERYFALYFAVHRMRLPVALNTAFERPEDFAQQARAAPSGAVRLAAVACARPCPAGRPRRGGGHAAQVGAEVDSAINASLTIYRTLINQSMARY